MFFILDTAERLGFARVWSEIEPQAPQGKKIKKTVQPLLPGDEERFDRTAAALTFGLKLARETGILQEILPLLAGLKSITGILERLADGEALDEGECFALKANLAQTRKLEDALKKYRPVNRPDLLAKAEGDVTDDARVSLSSYAAWMLHDAHANNVDQIPLIDPLDRLWDLLNPAEQETERFYLWDSYDPALTNIRQKKDQLQLEIRQLKRNHLTDLETRLKHPVPATGEVIIGKGDEDLLQHIQARSDFKLDRETFGAYFYKWLPDPQVLELEARLDGIEAEEALITAHVLRKLSREIGRDLTGLVQNQERLGELDWLLARVEYALRHDCIPAECITTNRIEIQGGRHLLVEAEVHKRGDEYTPIDLTVEQGVTVVTGSNMGGKTLNLRMVGLLTAMAQHGLCVPAQEMRLALRDFIYFSVDDDQTKGDLSTFGQEIVGLNQALAYREQQGLYLIDELARGTNPEEGEALGIAIVKHLQGAPCITILTTHFSALAGIHGVAHYRVRGLDQERYKALQSWVLDQISLTMINSLMDYRLEKVGHEHGVARDAIRVASLLGLKDTIIKEAEKQLTQQMKQTKGVPYSGQQIKSRPKTD